MAPIRTLIADDEPNILTALEFLLKRAGYDVRETGSGRDAIRLTPLPVDLVVLDIDLVDVDGFEVCRRLKSDEQTLRDIEKIQENAIKAAQDVKKFALR